MDEAGTSAKEPVSVLVGVILHADGQYVKAEVRLNEVLQLVPAKLRKDFVFHAKAVWGDHSYRDVWPFHERLDFLKKMMAIPRELGLAVALGIVRRDSLVPDDVKSKEKFQHVMAFFHCNSRADKYVRDYGGAAEVATVVAEDVDGVKEHLRGIVKALKDPEFTAPLQLTPDLLQPTLEERIRGISRAIAKFW